MEIEFGGYKLRPFRKGDEPSLTENINHRKIERYTLRIPYPYSLEGARGWVGYNLKLARRRERTELNFAIDLDGQVIGGIGLFSMNGHSAEIGYWLGVKYWGRGIVSGAVKALTDHALRDMKLRRVYAKVFPVNKASVRVLRKAGYKYEGRLIKEHLKHGRPVDALLFARTR
ncbi:MAG TPA: GNAT family N-acetyltransferase [Elusimicrobiales bacterium]|nr:GNAT family N-acetyltransferase [Elusimicrobiales bacterium]